MMLRNLLFLTFILYSPILWGQSYHAPSKIMFADLELRLTEALRKDIQAEVDALSRSPRFLNIKLDRAKIYFPIIERIFQEENLPEDFKYLVLQESALIPDAISTSNAVGFWQFKKEAAEEVGLRLDGGVDERMNIVSSTRGAAKYLKKNNFYFDNWLHALLAYYAGRGGAEKIVDQKFNSAKVMHLDRNLHWYAKKFLAHKIVFENALKDYPSPDIFLYEYSYVSNKSLKDVARDFSVDEEEVLAYNKWLKRDRAPADKEYTIIVPLKAGSRPDLVAVKTGPKESVQQRHKATVKEDDSQRFPEIEEFLGFDAYQVKINGKKGVIAKNKTDNINSLALIGNIPVERFRKYNDLDRNDEVKTGHVYYLQAKSNKAKAHHHILQPGEDLWFVSQKYGIKLDKLRQKNRIAKNEEPKPGMVLWLRFIRPAKEPVEFVPVSPVIKETPVVQTTKQEPPTKAPTDNISNSAPLINQASVEMRKEPVQKLDSTPDNAKMTLVQPNNAPTTHATATIERKVEKSSSNNESDLMHEVKQGETLYSISRQYEVSLTQIMSLNNLSYDDGIQIGQQLFIKKALSGSATTEQTDQSITKSYIYHKVLAGETLYKIARQYNVTIQELMEWNNKSDFNVSIGENLRVSK